MELKTGVNWEGSIPHFSGPDASHSHVDYAAQNEFFFFFFFFCDTVGGIQALGGLQGPPQTGCGVAQEGPVGVLAVLQGKFGWKTAKIFQVGFCRTQGA